MMLGSYFSPCKSLDVTGAIVVREGNIPSGSRTLYHLYFSEFFICISLSYSSVLLLVYHLYFSQFIIRISLSLSSESHRQWVGVTGTIVVLGVIFQVVGGVHFSGQESNVPRRWRTDEGANGKMSPTICAKFTSFFAWRIDECVNGKMSPTIRAKYTLIFCPSSPSQRSVITFDGNFNENPGHNF